MKQISNYIRPVLNSYAILFFSQNRVLAVLLLLVSFMNPSAGLTGLLCTCAAIALVRLMGYHRDSIQTGLYSFNSLLLGIGFGTFYSFNSAFWLWLFAACLLTITLTVVLTAWLGKYGLPVLSLPFISAFWLVLVASNGYPGMGLMQKESYLLVELNTGPQTTAIINFIKEIDQVCFGRYPDLFFRAVSSIFFQNSVIAGILMSIGLFIHSRIGFSLLVLGFVVACVFNAITGTYPEGISHYHLGANFMMVSFAMGGFFLIPSGRSYLWAIVSVPVTFMLVNALSRFLGVHNLPIFSLPFCLLTIALLYFFILRINPGKLQLTPIQHYSPEVNLYQFLNGRERLKDLQYLRLNLPFIGAWTVSQGYEGGITHKNEWGQALDFVIKDEDGNTYKSTGTRPEHFYCFNKPVLACADGVIEDVVDHIEDNEIGQVNTEKNWGNTVVIRHAGGLFSKVSHLKQHSVKVRVGEQIKQGDLLGLCGNSGRSHEPHLHFQAQLTPYIGSKTLAYPFAYFVSGTEWKQQLHSFETPVEGMEISPVDMNAQLKQAFSWQPGYAAKLTADNGRTETVEVFTDAYNQLYLYSKESGATLYFVNNGTCFYFTAFYGDESSLLYQFYLAAYKVVFSADSGITATDIYPLQTKKFQPGIWLHDVIAAFYQFIRRTYSSSSSYQHQQLTIHAKGYTQILNRKKETMSADINIAEGALRSFNINLNGTKTAVTWQTEHLF
ncbi:urea transporter [Mucilaginibacter myungsuensis]|uniref:Urea transporter n=1 Tax=Mucilaginibacter myungsuensis TaxID=649104 RepID=A0A929PY82_9SPHI|nr:urea transporter [Mucilaginibacter myungsuensis]MBE9664623.1 urea transporter [Mucilaginibacter myungsuensis]MDN3601487.1 urea transporter [Mucilaginibacter myungsuensis]